MDSMPQNASQEPDLLSEESLQWLQRPVQFIKGVGPYLAGLFAKVQVRTLEDLLYHLPFRYIDRRQVSTIAELMPGQDACIFAEVGAAGEVLAGYRRKRIYEVVFSDGSATLHAKWFHYSRKFFDQRFKKGEKFLLFGKLDVYKGVKQFVHPDAQPIREFLEEEELQKHLGLLPVYSSTEGLNQRQIRKALEQVLAETLRFLPETLPSEILAAQALPELRGCFEHLHRPGSDESAIVLNSKENSAFRRLAFEELFFVQLGLHLRRGKVRRNLGYAHKNLHGLSQRLIDRLPFQLTAGQQRCLDEIYRDMESPFPMNRLLQGDVGSGKTLVCLMAGLLSVENGWQTAVMVPTEILAEQHERNFQRLLQPLGTPTLRLTASTPNSVREEILGRISAGEPCIVVGTHALLEEDVRFSKLSLVVIDEQHRFGVRQRMKLIKKGKPPDVLVMTATPIPRSLAMTLYGDLDLSLMTEMPPGRQPVVTRIMMERDRPKLEDFLRKKIAEGRQAYFVYPLIEESEKLDLRDAKKGFERLREVFPEFKLGMLHGRMKNHEKEEVMRSFSAGKIQILVATTVIEVGIDVPNASLLVVEHAERFGLSQLHQLRGRVGRGSEKSYCILATDFRRSNLAKERLKVMEESANGFRIAEEDLTLRGPGDFLGTRQSGIPDFRVASLISDLDLLEAAKLEVQKILQQDPELQSERNRVLRRVLEYRWSGRLGLAGIG